MRIRNLWNLLFKRKKFNRPASFFDKRNIKGFIQGHMRKLKAEYGALDEHILEQAAWRLSVANKACIDTDQCQACGCFPMSDKVLEDRPCEGQCYPAMMNKEEWDSFKRKNNIVC